MENFYALLGVKKDASSAAIKTAFREKAKRVHPDIAGSSGENAMRKLIAAYETLSDGDRRYEYDRALERLLAHLGKGESFDYRTFLREKGDGRSIAKLIFFELLHLEEEEALAEWDASGGLAFRLDEFLDREDYMDCGFIIAEELAARRRYYEAFVLLAGILREERRKPYFRHFAEEVEAAMRELVRLRLKNAVDGETWNNCLMVLLKLGFPQKDQKKWKKMLKD